MKRLQRQARTLELMLEAFCRHHNGGSGPLCGECRELARYADYRLARCHYGPEKPTCENCPIPCYIPERREQVREVMRWAGPRMLRRHPILAIMHLIDSRRQAPEPVCRK